MGDIAFLFSIHKTYLSFKEKELFLGRRHLVLKGISPLTSVIAISNISSPLAPGPWSCNVPHWKTFLYSAKLLWPGQGGPCFLDIEPDMQMETVESICSFNPLMLSSRGLSLALTQVESQPQMELAAMWTTLEAREGP